MWRLNSAGRILGLTLSLGVTIALAQEARPAGLFSDWRPIGSRTLNAAPADAATGGVDRLWFAPDGTLVAHTDGGLVFKEESIGSASSWTSAANLQNEPKDEISIPASVAARVPEPAVRLLRDPRFSYRWYALGRQLYRTEDGGKSWTNLTSDGKISILGGAVRTLVFPLSDPDVLIAGAATGVWRSVDSGASWAGVNESLPNLPVRRIASTPNGLSAFRIELNDGRYAEWAPGERVHWRLSAAPKLTLPAALAKLNLNIVQIEANSFARTAEGRLIVSTDGGTTWDPTLFGNRGHVANLFADGNFALAAVDVTAADIPGGHLFRTTNGGRTWDDISGDLPDSPAFGVTGDRDSGALYLATAAGLFRATLDFNIPGPAPTWTRIATSLPAAPVRDVRLDGAGNQIYVAVEGYGLYASLAPHRAGRLRLVSAADLNSRAAAPGALFSVLGLRVRACLASGRPCPVLSASAAESQIQLPYQLTGDQIQLFLDADQGQTQLTAALKPTSPAIFVATDGSPLLIDADSGTMVDSQHPVTPGMRVQILMSGLGRVTPEWPAGVPGPVDRAPVVQASLLAYLDGQPVEVTRGTLAPGFTGVYLVELAVPRALNSGFSELYVTAAGSPSNRVRLPVEVPASE